MPGGGGLHTKGRGDAKFWEHPDAVQSTWLHAQRAVRLQSERGHGVRGLPETRSAGSTRGASSADSILAAFQQRWRSKLGPARPLVPPRDDSLGTDRIENSPRGQQQHREVSALNSSYYASQRSQVEVEEPDHPSRYAWETSPKSSCSPRRAQKQATSDASQSRQQPLEQNRRSSRESGKRRGKRRKSSESRSTSSAASSSSSSNGDRLRQQRDVRGSNPTMMAKRGSASPSPEKHEGVVCVACQQLPIQGPRFRCRVCQDASLCEACYSHCARLHHPDHRFYVMKALKPNKKGSERVSTTEEGPQHSAPMSPPFEFVSARASPSHVSGEAVGELIAQSSLMAEDQSMEKSKDIDEVVMLVPPPDTLLPVQGPEAAAAEAEAESAAVAPTGPPVSEEPAVAAAPVAETTVATPAPEVAARQMQEMWENLGKGYTVDWQKQDIGIDIGGRPNKRQKVKQKQQNLSTTSHDQQGASTARIETGKDRTDDRQTRKTPGEEKLQTAPNDGDIHNSSSEVNNKQEQSTVEVSSTVGHVKASASSSSRQACGQWMPRGGRCSRCRGKTSDEYGGVVCRRRRADRKEVGCCKGVCWRCMKPTPGDELGKIRTTKRDFQALGRRAWWLHESCMTATDEEDYFLLMKPTPT